MTFPPNNRYNTGNQIAQYLTRSAQKKINNYFSEESLYLVTENYTYILGLESN